LNKGEGTTIIDKANAVGWYLTAVFKEGYAPRKGNDAYEWPVTAHACLLKF
jgi:hypothetical protein